MKTIVFSDTHLSDKFEPERFEYFKSIIEPADRVIINGDFWEGEVINFEQFINSRWQELFPLLKKKETIYIYGNHDPKMLMDKHINEFSNQQTNEFRIKHRNQELIIRHGDDFESTRLRDQKRNKLVFFKNKAVFIPERLIMKKFDYNFPGDKLLKWNFLRIMEIGLKQLNEDQVMVCGHTHLPEFDLNKKYINTGFINYGLATHLEIEENMPLKLIKEKY